MNAGFIADGEMSVSLRLWCDPVGVDCKWIGGYLILAANIFLQADVRFVEEI